MRSKFAMSGSMTTWRRSRSLSRLSCAFRTDHDDHAIARCDRVLDRGHEVLARMNVLNVHEHLIAAEAGGQPIAQPPDRARPAAERKWSAHGRWDNLHQLPAR